MCSHVLFHFKTLHRPHEIFRQGKETTHTHKDGHTPHSFEAHGVLWAGPIAAGAGRLPSPYWQRAAHMHSWQF